MFFLRRKRNTLKRTADQGGPIELIYLFFHDPGWFFLIFFIFHFSHFLAFWVVTYLFIFSGGLDDPHFFHFFIFLIFLVFGWLLIYLFFYRGPVDCLFIYFLLWSGGVLIYLFFHCPWSWPGAHLFIQNPSHCILA